VDTEFLHQPREGQGLSAKERKQYIGVCPYHKAFMQPVELSCLSREHFTNKSARTPDDEPLETLSKLLLALSMNVFRGLFVWCWGPRWLYMEEEMQWVSRLPVKFLDDVEQTGDAVYGDGGVE
jgi:hypothetical protein